MKHLNLKLFFIILLFSQLSACSGTSLKKDESVVMFPTSATLDNQGIWQLPIHNWVFEKEEKSLGRKATQKVFSEILEGLDVPEIDADSAITQKRLMWFLVDNKRNKQITVRLNGSPIKLDKTAPNGHANTLISIPKSAGKARAWQTLLVEDKYKRGFSGEIQLIPEKGISVISDIDDTIKISDVLDKKKLLINIFVNPYKATPGFPEYYKKLAQQGAYFHYVSASPWQLYPSLKPFMDKYYPKGTISLRYFRIKDSSFIKFFQASSDYKIAAISKIFKRYPGHQFILIGDSGEHDPEVYAQIYKQFPAQVRSILIRAVAGSDLTKARFSSTFKEVPKSIWQLVRIPTELK